MIRRYCVTIAGAEHYAGAPGPLAAVRCVLIRLRLPENTRAACRIAKESIR